jgi:hypothetical protein
MFGQEQPRQAQPVPQSSIAQFEAVAEPGVAIQQTMIVLGGETGDCGGHRPITARAAAYSTARYSLDRCTYPAVVSGEA